MELRRRWGFHHADGNPVGVVNAEDADADKAFVRMQVPSASRFELRVPVITYCDGGTCIERGQNLPIGATCIGPRRTCIHLYTSHDNRILSTNSAPPEAAFGVTAARLGRWSSAIPKYSEMADISRRTTSSIDRAAARRRGGQFVTAPFEFSSATGRFWNFKRGVDCSYNMSRIADLSSLGCAR